MSWAHGTYTGYTTGGCRCPKCRRASTLYNKHRAMLIERSTWQPFTDATPARKHVADLFAAGFSRDTIAELAGVAGTTIRSLTQDGRPLIRTRVAEKLLAVRPTLDDMPDWGKTDATGSRRRIQALAVAGWSPQVIADRLGVDRSMLRKLMNRPTVRVYNARAIRDLFAQMWDQPPPNETRYERAVATRARNFAARNGWMPVGAWDDIDDPSETPDLGESSPYQAALAENAEELIVGQGYTPEFAAERLGVKLRSLQDARRWARKHATWAVDA